MTTETERRDALLESQYRAGVTAGWNAANSDDPEKRLAALLRYDGHAAPFKQAKAPTISHEEILDKLEAWRFNVELECSGASLCAIEAIALGGAILKLSDLRDVLEWASRPLSAPTVSHEEMVEKVARALHAVEESWYDYEWDRLPTDTQNEFVKQARAAIASLSPLPTETTKDWWKPDPEDPFWMLEVRQGFDEAGAWLKNRDSQLTTRDPAKALRFPSWQHADMVRRQLGGSGDGRFEPTEHLWTRENLGTPTPETIRSQRDREICAWLRVERWDSEMQSYAEGFAEEIESGRVR